MAQSRKALSVICCGTQPWLKNQTSTDDTCWWQSWEHIVRRKLDGCKKKRSEAWSNEIGMKYYRKAASVRAQEDVKHRTTKDKLQYFRIEKWRNFICNRKQSPPTRRRRGLNKLVAGRQQRHYPAAHKWAGEEECTTLISSYHHFKPSHPLHPKPDEMIGVGWAGL